MTALKLCLPRRAWCAAAGAALALAAAPAQALTFEFSFIAGTSAQAQAAFVEAGAVWSALLTDPVTVRLTVGTGTLGGSTLATASSDQVSFAFDTVRSALLADATGGLDSAAANALPSGSFGMLINRTTENGNSALPYLDNNGSDNNSNLLLTTANAKALGLPFAPSTIGGLCIGGPCDGYIQFSTAFSWDFDRGNGISAGQIDFTGVAIHEIGHALGFISGVDVLDGNPGFAEDAYAVATPLDLFRWSPASTALGVMDFTASSTIKHFNPWGSITFATGATFGDGRQASHWKDGRSLGVMDPTAPTGQLMTLTAFDQAGFDVIGWALVPEPGKPALFALGLAVLGIGAWRRQRRARLD